MSGGISAPPRAPPDDITVVGTAPRRDAGEQAGTAAPRWGIRLSTAQRQEGPARRELSLGVRRRGPAGSGPGRGLSCAKQT